MLPRQLTSFTQTGQAFARGAELEARHAKDGSVLPQGGPFVAYRDGDGKSILARSSASSKRHASMRGPE